MPPPRLARFRRRHERVDQARALTMDFRNRRGETAASPSVRRGRPALWRCSRDRLAASHTRFKGATLSPLDDTEDVELAVSLLRLQELSGLIDEVRHVDHRERIRTFEHEHPADRHSTQRLLCA